MSPASFRSSQGGVDRSKDADHFEYTIGQLLGEKKKYRVTGHLGDGTFGRALQCEDIEQNKIVAVKVVRAVERYTHSAKIEASILNDIKNKGGCSQNIVDLQEMFTHESNEGRI